MCSKLENAQSDLKAVKTSERLKIVQHDLNFEINQNDEKTNHISKHLKFMA